MFWFKTRQQHLNTPFAGSVVQLDFISKLYYFHQKSGIAFNKLPMIDKRYLDLFHLHQCVRLRGGYSTVCRKKMWAQIGRELGYTGKIMTSLSTSLKSSYQKYVLTYDEFLINLGIIKSINTTQTSTGNGVFSENFFFINPDYTIENIFALTSPSVDLQSHVLQLQEDEKKSIKDGKKSIKSFALPNGFVLKFVLYNEALQNNSPILNEPCINDPGYAIVGNSHAKFHRFEKPLKEPLHADASYELNLEGLADSNKESPIYNFRQFQQKSQLFSNTYFKCKNLLPKNKQDIYDIDDATVEREYWSLLAEKSNIEVEYGADIHTSIHSSPFPQPERNARNFDLNDKWNFHILPFTSNSFSQFIDTPINFMIQPWLYIGMLFSTQAWSFSDFYSYSLSYSHFGSTRTWYSVPEEYSDKFRSLLTELNEKRLQNTGRNDYINTKNSNKKSTPSSIFESDIMLSPEILDKQYHIKSYAINQQPGQIVVNFPKSYHCHFNHGFNLIESVNLLPFNDWIPYGKMCNSLFKSYKQQPPFSIEKLLINVANYLIHNDKIDTQLCLPISKHIIDMCRSEAIKRGKVLKQFPNIEIVTELEDRFDLVYLSSNSRQYSYLSRINSLENSQVYTLEEFLNLDITDCTQFELVVRISDRQLTTLIAQMQSLNDPKKNWSTSLANDWRNRYVQYMTESQMKPVLEILREFYQEANQIDGLANTEEVSLLKKFLKEADNWLKSTSPLLHHISILSHDWTGAGPLDTFELQRRANEILVLPFVCAETTAIEQWATEVQLFLDSVHDMISCNIKENGQKLFQSRILSRGQQLGVDVNELEHWIQQAIWLRKVIDAKQLMLSSEDVKNLLKEGYMLGVKVPAITNSLPSIAAKGPSKNSIILPMPSLLTKVSVRDHAQLLDKIQDVITRPPYNKAQYMDAVSLYEDACANRLDSPLVEKLAQELNIVHAWISDGLEMFGLDPFSPDLLKKWLYILRKATISSVQTWEDGQVYCLCRTGRRNAMIMCESCNEWYHCTCLRDRGYEFPDPNNSTKTGQSTGTTPTPPSFYSLDMTKKQPLRCPICTMTFLAPGSQFFYRYTDDDGKEHAIKIKRVTLEEFESWTAKCASLPLNPDCLDASEILNFLKQYCKEVETTYGKVWMKLSIKNLQLHLRKVEGSLILAEGLRSQLQTFIIKRQNNDVEEMNTNGNNDQRGKFNKKKKK